MITGWPAARAAWLAARSIIPAIPVAIQVLFMTPSSEAIGLIEPHTRLNHTDADGADFIHPGFRLSVVRQVVRFLWYVNCPVMAVDEGRVPR
jgi:hypothetical protein